MNNGDLNRLLRNAEVPEPRPGFWDELPSDVQRGVARGLPMREAEAERRTFQLIRFLLKRAMPLSLATVCVILGFIWGAQWRKSNVAAAELAEARACWREAAALFPNQLQTIVFDQQGSRIVLSEHADRPVFAPVFVKLCRGKSCERFITFSGQQIKVGAESFEVLVGRGGEVLLVGRAKVWSSATHTADFGRYKVTARPLADS
jgi:hypothetical protein